MHLGALPLRGERGTLIVSLDALLRMSSNPFFPYLTAQIEEQLPAPPAIEPPQAKKEPAKPSRDRSQPLRQPR